MVKFKDFREIELPANYNKLSQPDRATVRERYARLQDGKCYYCKELLARIPTMNRDINWRLFPKGFLNYPIHLHHSHKTGLTLGAVHAYCNAVLWQYHGE